MCSPLPRDTSTFNCAVSVSLGTALFAVLMLGCHGDSDAPGRSIGDDAGPLSQTALTTLLADSTACVSAGVIGGYREHPPRTLSYGNATFLADGRLVFYDNATHQLRIIAPDGTELAQLGRRGGGPGEFMLSPSVKAWLGDIIATYEHSSRRLQLFTQTGFARQVALPAQEGGLFLGIVDGGWMLFCGHRHSLSGRQSSQPSGASRSMMTRRTISS